MKKYTWQTVLIVTSLVGIFFYHQNYIRVKEECEEDIIRIKTRIYYLDKQLKKIRKERNIQFEIYFDWENRSYSYRLLRHGK